MSLKSARAVMVVQCCKRTALPESLKDGGDLPTRLSIRDWHKIHDFGGHEAQADRHDGLRVRQHREGLRIVHAGTNEELDMIAENMDLLWSQTSALARRTAFALRRVEATVVST